MGAAMVDVAVLGAGPAGAAVARMLAMRGWEVALVGGDWPARLRSSEVISPQCRHAIEKLLPPDVLDNPLVSSKCAGIQSRWASQSLDYEVYDERALLVDRPVLDKMLSDAAGAAGAGLHGGCRVQRLSMAPTHIELEGTRSGAPWSLNARFLVDATGRSSRIVRLLGIKRRRLTHQVAVFGRAHGVASGSRDEWFRVERSRFGWWSAVNLPRNSWEIVFYRRLPSRKPDPELIRHLFSSTQLAQEAGEWDRAERGRGVDASFSALETVQGHRWLAVGDAAIAFDPISSQGLWHALGSAEAAAGAIDEYLARGETHGLADYAFRTLATVRHHLRELHRHYEDMP